MENGQMERLTILCPEDLKTTPKQEINLLIYAGGEKILEQKISQTSFLDILTTAICAPYLEKMGGIKSTIDQENSF